MRGATSLKYTLTIGIAALTLVAVVGCSGRGGKSIGKFYGEQLSQDDLYRTMEGFGTPNAPAVLVRTQGGNTNALLAEPIALQALRNLVIRKLTIQIAKEDGVAPTADAVDKELKFQSNLDPDYLVKRTRTGLTLSRVKEMIEYNLAREGILTKGVTVDLSEAQKFYKDNPLQFTEPATADLLWVAVKGADKQAAVDKDLRAGESFRYVASKYSIANNAREMQGAFPQRVISQMDARIQKVVNATPESRATAGWLSLDGGISAKFYVNAKTPPKPIQMDKYRMEELRRSIARDRGSIGKDLDARLREKLRDSGKTIVIEDRSLSELWKDWLDKNTKDAKATPSTTPNGSEAPAAK
jgi:hypothetical protein